MKSRTIFIVDNNSVYGNLLKYHLNGGRNSCVRVFSHSAECLGMLYKNANPDFIIAHLTETHIDSIEFLHLVKKYSPASKVIFFSAMDDEVLAARLLCEGADDYIHKTGHPEKNIQEVIKNLEFLYHLSFQE